MYWANFLHFYQPAEQQPDILGAIVEQSYRPIFQGLVNAKQVRLTININGTLLELFDIHKHQDLLDMLRELGASGRVEFTSSAKYHAFLPLVEEREIIRQIKINDETNKYYLGDAYKPKGFFPPEMGYKTDLAPLLQSLGFEWVILDEIAATGNPGDVDYTKLHKIKGTDLFVFFRERRLSNLIMSAVVRTPETLLDAMREDLESQRFLVTAMDGETFGHHRPGLEQTLFDVFKTSQFQLIQVSDIPKFYKDIVEVSPKNSTWASSKLDIDNGIQFLSWYDPENRIHKWQWELVELVLQEVYAMDPNHARYKTARDKMDAALGSDHVWWASAKPWWSIEMIEFGAYKLMDTIRAIPDVHADALRRAKDLYEKIISTAFNWQRTGRVRQMMKDQGSILRIPFRDRTVSKGGAEEGVYHAFMEMMQRLEKDALERREYEKAILWRDAMYKLEHKLDIYDVINAIDLVRAEIPHKEVEALILKYKEKYRELRGGQPEQRGS